jgi:hypothetical protein
MPVRFVSAWRWSALGLRLHFLVQARGELGQILRGLREEASGLNPLAGRSD